MEGVERAHRLDRERSPRPVADFVSDAQPDPMARGPGKGRALIDALRLREEARATRSYNANSADRSGTQSPVDTSTNSSEPARQITRPSRPSPAPWKSAPESAVPVKRPAALAM